MKKILCLVLVLCLAISMTSVLADAVSGTYTYHIQGDDWGCGVDKAILTLSEAVEGLTAENLTVTENKTTLDWGTFSIVPAAGPRNVVAVYACDAEGNAVEGASQYWTVELNIDPNEGSPLLYKFPYNVWCDPYTLTFETAEDAPELAIAAEPTAVTSSTDPFEFATYDAADMNGNAITYNYALYTPAAETKTMVVWLHGQGEGASGLEGYTDGTDARIPILGAEVTALAGDDFQSMMGGAYVLAPQSPSVWMDGGSGDIEGLAYSIYTESLHDLITMVKEQTGVEMIIIAGCSNGGYMTMIMAINYGAEYTAYVPVCEALKDEFITDEKIEALAKLPMFFIYSQDDGTVDPTLYEIPTLARLQAANAENLHVFAPEHVFDTTGRFTNVKIWFQNELDGTYMGHWSWIYFFNNTAVCETSGETVWSWMAEQ